MQPYRTATAHSWVKFAILGVTCLIIGLGMGRFLSKPEKTQPAHNSTAATGEQSATSVAMTVEAIYPSEQVLSRGVEASGNVVGQDVAEVGAKVSGVAIAQVLADVGDEVKQGQVLARLDNRQASANVASASAEVQQAQINLAKASSDLRRVEPLIKIDAISREQYDAYKTNKLNAEASLTAAKARLANSQISEGDANVVAPVSGVVSQKLANVGMMTSGTTLFSIVKNGKLEWQASVPAAQINNIYIGQQVRIRTGHPDVMAMGVVSKIAPVANNSREITVYVAITEPASLRGGMYQSGEFVGAQHAAITLPISVVTTSDGYDYIWTLSKSPDSAAADNTANAKLPADVFYVRRQKINVSARSDEGVVTDLPRDTLIVKSSGNFLSDNDLVKVANFGQLSSTHQSTQP